MTDIVKRLKAKPPKGFVTSPLMIEAATEIERLRGLLKNWVDCCFVNFATDTIEIVDVGKVYVETRAALKGEE